MRKLVLVSADPDRIGSQLDSNPLLNRDITFVTRGDEISSNTASKRLLVGREFYQPVEWNWWINTSAIRNLSTIRVS